MESSSGALDRLLSYLKLLVDRSRYTVGRFMRKLGRSHWYLAHVLDRQQRLPLDELLKMLEALEERPSWFVTAALGDHPPPEVHLGPLDTAKPGRSLERMERALEETAALEATARAPRTEDDPDELARELVAESFQRQLAALRDGERYRHPAFARAYLEELDDLRYGETKRAARLADATAVRLLPRVCASRDELVALQCRALGVFAASHRLIGDFAVAARALRVAFEAARDHRLDLARADLLQRATYLLADQAAYPVALATSGEALLIYLRKGDQVGAGKAMVDQAHALFHLDRLEEAQELLEQALPRLEGETPALRRHRFSALQRLARIATLLGNHEAGEGYVSAALESVGDARSSETAKLMRLQGILAWDRGDLPEAERKLTEAFDILEEKGHTDIALIGLELVEVLIARGRSQRAQALGVRLDAFARRRAPGNKILRACTAALLKALVRGQVTERFLAGLRRRIEPAPPGARGR